MAGAQPKLDDLVARARALVGTRRRALLGIAGEPGTGKSTLAAELVAALNRQHPQDPPWAAQVPMDGFHLADAVLAQLRLLHRKGAPETFDADGFVALLARLRAAREPVTYAPEFERDLEQPLAGALAVARGTRLVVVEGNYLLLQRPPWDQVHRLLDTTWLVTVDDEVRLARLVDRHIRFGKDDAAARRWVEQVDEPDAALVRASAARADLVVRLPS